MEHSTRQKNWFSAAVIFMLFWFPPMAFLAGFNLIRSRSMQAEDSDIKALRYVSKARKNLRFGFLAGQVLFVILCAYIFAKGGDLISSLDSFF